MGTLIQDAAEVATIAGQIDTAITTKGGTLVGGGKLRNAVAGINSITSEWKWEKPSDWPDLIDVVNNQMAEVGVGVATRVAALYDLPDAYSVTVPSGVGYVTDGGATGTGSVTLSFTAGKHWIFFYTDTTPWSGLPLTTSNGLYSLLWIVGDGDTVLNSGNWNWNVYTLEHLDGVESVVGRTSSNIVFRALVNLKEINCDITLPYAGDKTANTFYACESLRSVKCAITASSDYAIKDLFATRRCLESVEITIPGNTNCSGVFNNCPRLKTIKGTFDFSNSVSVANLFSSCTSLEALPDYLDFSSATNVSSAFATMYSLKALPKVIVPNLTSTSALDYNFSNSTNISRASVLEFAEFPTIPTGKPSAGKTGDATGAAGTRTLTLNSQIKYLFTEDEQTDVEDALYDKDWTLAW